MAVTSPRRLGALALAAAFAVAACAPAASPTPAPGASPTPTPASGVPAPGATGSIVVSGSSTVEPIAAGVAVMFKEANPDWYFQVEGPGTGDGFARFCAGETDIATASRTIKDVEAADCAAAGIEYVGLRIAFDGMAVLTNVNNTAVSCLSFADIYALVGPESTGFQRWSDAGPIAAELGSNTVFPAADLVITGPGEESGTYDSFVELVLEEIADQRGQEAETRPDYISTANDNVIIEGITTNPTSFGWVGLAFAEENADKVRKISISADVNGACVAPNAQTVSDGTYPIARPLYIYVNKAKAAANPAVAAYVDFFLAEGTIATVLETVPYVNLPAEELAATRAAWAAR